MEREKPTFDILGVLSGNAFPVAGLSMPSQKILA